MKAIPEDPIKFLRPKNPDTDWETQTAYRDSGLIRAQAECVQYLKQGPAWAKANCRSFVEYVFYAIADLVHAPVAEGEKRSRYECFSPMRRA